ncbi:MAG: hypothetical protein ACE5DS_07680 [Kiloniellaceae bacterium]
MDRGTYALASSEAVPREQVIVAGERVRGRHCARAFPAWLDRDNNVKKFRKAALNAMAKAPGANALIDVELNLTSRNCAEVEGRPVVLR